MRKFSINWWIYEWKWEGGTIGPILGTCIGFSRLNDQYGPTTRCPAKFSLWIGQTIDLIICAIQKNHDLLDAEEMAEVTYFWLLPNWTFSARREIIDFDLLKAWTKWSQLLMKAFMVLRWCNRNVKRNIELYVGRVLYWQVSSGLLQGSMGETEISINIPDCNWGFATNRNKSTTSASYCINMGRIGFFVLRRLGNDTRALVWINAKMHSPKMTSSNQVEHLRPRGLRINPDFWGTPNWTWAREYRCRAFNRLLRPFRNDDVTSGKTLCPDY